MGPQTDVYGSLDVHRFQLMPGIRSHLHGTLDTCHWQLAKLRLCCHHALAAGEAHEAGRS